ncbi:putative phage tail protein [Paenibacillus ginsengarvi]|uniref:DUF2313 domain-containing protein n=1 Tax=Paenibacillus ginsengarvi TaxID=400777 RepID=A0A3B0CLW5_9BACL|nr:putative phage tail protein [Paenibacillus ginsengarvi]RKN85861.1 DUF2313 domain-containing protein [Paenibacillus ginsengarvi]
MNKPVAPYWPDYYQGIRDFIELAATEDAELQLVVDAITQLLNDQFVLTSGLAAIKRREKMLSIRADSNVESLDFRRKRIVNRYSTKPPFTTRYLQERLDFLVGAGRAAVSIDVQNFILTVAAAIDDAAIFREVEWTVRTTIPANLVYRQQTAVGDILAFEEHIVKRTMDRETRLGSNWRLGVMPFASLEPEVIIK